MNYQDKYVVMLKTEFANRQLANGMYSMRAFARDLEIEAPRLSMIFSKAKGISRQKAQGIVSKLNWPNTDKEVFLDFIDAAHARSKKQRAQAIERIQTDHAKKMSSIEKYVEDDLFKQIADPIHYQIIEALKLKDVDPSLEGLFNVLNYSNQEIEEAARRLMTLGFIEQEKGKLTVNEYVIRTAEKNPSMAIRKHHSHILKAALNSINEQSVEERCLSALTVSVPKEALPEIFEKIQCFRKEINELIMNHQNQNKDDIYCLSTQFFRLSKEREV